MKQEIELITQEELEVLRKYRGIEKDQDGYERLSLGPERQVGR